VGTRKKSGGQQKDVAHPTWLDNSVPIMKIEVVFSLLNRNEVANAKGYNPGNMRGVWKIILLRS